MGCFSIQCAISGLPIHAGDDVRYLLLQQAPHEDWTRCYPNSVWTPLTFPIKAKYNDYGSIEAYKENYATKVWHELLKEVIVEKPVENKTRDVPVNGKMSFDDLLTSVREDRIEVKNPYGRFPTRLVQQAMIREDVWQLLVSGELEEVYVPGDPGGFKTAGLEFYRESAPKALELFRERVRPAPKFENEEESVQHFLKLMEVRHEHSGSPLFDVLGGRWATGSDRGRGRQMCMEIFAKMVEDGEVTKKETEEFLDVASETEFVENMAGMLRYWWRPSYTVGPQYSNWKNHVWYAKGILEISKKEKKAQDEY